MRRVLMMSGALLIVPALATGCGTAPESAEAPVSEAPVQIEEAAEVAQDVVEEVAEDAPVEEEANAPEPPEMLDKGDGAEVIVSDVLDYSLEPASEWADTGQFGWVQFQLHEGRYDGEPIHYIRTDASDADFATENGLVYVPLLAAATTVDGATSALYVFDDGAEGQLPVMASAPGDEDFSPAWRVHEVSFSGSPSLLESADAIEAAAEAGEVTVEPTRLVVNYPIVKWPGGQLPIDDSLDSYLGTGQLIELDEAAATVTFKLHECYTGARYIVTDSSAGAMATDMMHIAASPPTAKLAEAGAVDNIWVFGNGIEGSGVMGFQPAIFRNVAGTPAWSPFWDHYTLTWADGVEPRVLESGADVMAAIEAGEVVEWSGTPDTHPNGFVVNCPVPIRAPNTFDGG